MGKTFNRFIRILVLIAVLIGLGGQAPITRANGETVFLVNSTGDDGDANTSDGICETASGNGVCTLRAAIQQASFGWGIDPNPRFIRFSISPSTPAIDRIIMIGSALPTINFPIAIQGPNQGNNAAIVLDGNAGDYNGLWITTGTITIRGLTIRNFGQSGIFLQGASGVTIAGNRIGNFGWNSTAGNDYGIYLGGIGGSNSIVIGGVNAVDRNIISGNAKDGININSGFTNAIWGNYIGVDQSGSAALENGWSGIRIGSGAWGNSIGGNSIAKRNVIAANNRGISIYDSHSNFIQGNYIGVDASGTFAIANEYGIFLDKTDSNMIGGLIVNEGNVISGNSEVGIRLGNSEFASENDIIGNILGANADLTAAIPNGAGIEILKGVKNNIGGTAVGAGNVLAGNSGVGIVLSSSSAITTTIQGNWIGVNKIGEALPNGITGIAIGNASYTTVGGDVAGAANTIAYNGNHGVSIFGSSAYHNLVIGNRIYNNTLLGIKLGTGPLFTPNDPGDGDVGPNDYQNFPVITSVTYSSGNMLTIQGTLNSNISQHYTIHFYGNDTCDPSGHGEGKVYLGKVSSVITDSSGNASFSFGPYAAATRYIFITATVTDLYKNTSEFSYCKSPYAQFLPVLVR